jgi:CheY-like chemotaxis protein
MDRFLTGRRVLVVEDEVLILMMIEEMLADLGCESIASASMAATAVALVEADAFDVAMLDMNLNGKSSLAVAKALAAHGVPFVFATGNSRDEVWDGFGDRPVLRKPFRFEELAGSLTRALAG